MTASEQAKSMGLKSLAVVAELTQQSPQTLDNWHKNKPELFRIVLLGCLLQITAGECGGVVTINGSSRNLG